MPEQFITRETFAEGGKAGGLRKQFIAEIKADDESKRRLQFAISTASIDRDNDRIEPEGWHLDSYRKNPVVLWAHDFTGLPVARSIDIGVQGGVLRSVAEFVPAEISEFADRVYRLYKAGFLSATSVGFRPLKWAFNEERKYGIDFSEQELLEYSAVPVPSNPDAMIEARAAGIDMTPVTAWALDVLKRNAPPEITDIRSFETLLRDVGGFSRTEAKAVASHGWKALNAQREAEAAVPALKALLNEIRKPLSF